MKKNIIYILTVIILTIISSCSMDSISSYNDFYYNDSVLTFKTIDMNNFKLFDEELNEITDIELLNFVGSIYNNSSVLKDNMQLYFDIGNSYNTRKSNVENCYHSWNSPTVISSGTHWHWFRTCLIKKYVSTCKYACGIKNTFESHEYKE